MELITFMIQTSCDAIGSGLGHREKALESLDPRDAVKALQENFARVAWFLVKSW